MFRWNYYLSPRHPYTQKVWNILVKATLQPLISTYPKNLEYLGGSSITSPLPSKLPQSRPQRQESCQTMTPPQRCSRSLHRLFKLYRREQAGGFLVFHPRFLSGRLDSHLGAFVSVKPGLFLIQFNLFDSDYSVIGKVYQDAENIRKLSQAHVSVRST